jgi:hypothetical protein
VDNGEQDHQSRWIRFNIKEEDGQRTSFGTLPDEDASFEQLYSLQRIELPKKLRENHGRDKSWQLLIPLKMAGFVPAENSASGGRHANHPADRYKCNDHKGVRCIGESPHSVTTGLSPY